MFNSNGNGYSLSDIAAVTHGNGDGFLGGFGGDGAWLILFILFALGGWGGFGGFGGYGMGGLGAGMLGSEFMMWPWMMTQNTDNIVANGFTNQGLANQLTGIQSSITSGFGDTALGIAGINQNICNSANGITSAITNGFANAESADNARQIANMQQAFNAQTAITAGLTGLQGQLAQCCCDNRAATADLKYTVATEACADRNAVSNALRDVLEANNASTQRILDQLCQDKIDAKNDTIAQLRSELQFARGQASQDVQTARILAGQTSEVDALYNRLNSCPVPTTPVYGRTPIFTCNNGGCGCGYGYNNFVA